MPPFPPPSPAKDIDRRKCLLRNHSNRRNLSLYNPWNLSYEAFLDSKRRKREQRTDEIIFSYPYTYRYMHYGDDTPSRRERDDLHPHTHTLSLSFSFYPKISLEERKKGTRDQSSEDIIHIYREIYTYIERKRELR